MDLKEYMFLLLIIIITGIFCSYYTYRILNKKIESINDELDELRNLVDNRQVKENYRNASSKITQEYTQNGVLNHSNDIQLFGNVNKIDNNVPVNLENHNVEVHCYDGSEISLKGSGGPTCLTRPFYREFK